LGDAPAEEEQQRPGDDVQHAQRRGRDTHVGERIIKLDDGLIAGCLNRRTGRCQQPNQQQRQPVW
jgi:hypothetical protein